MRREGEMKMGDRPKGLPDPGQTWAPTPPRPVLVPQDPRGTGPGLELCPLS